MDTLDSIVNKVMSVILSLLGVGWIASMVYHWDNIAHRALSVLVIPMCFIGSWVFWKLKD